MHSSRYRNPESLPQGAALVVGSAQSGAQIAEELYQQGRDVFLSVGGAGRAPRRYRGKDVVAWLSQIGFFNITPDKLPVPKEHFAPPHVSGTKGGHTLNLHQFAREGVTLLGHLHGASDDTISLALDLHETLARVDQFEREVQKMIDGYVQANGLDAPEEELPQLRDGYEQPIIEELDLKATGITTIIWATGYNYDYGLVKMPIFDGDGFPIQTRGVTNHDGLYFVGMPWMPSLKTGILAGVGECAEHIASHIAAADTNHRGAVMPARATPRSRPRPSNISVHDRGRRAGTARRPLFSVPHPGVTTPMRSSPQITSSALRNQRHLNRLNSRQSFHDGRPMSAAILRGIQRAAGGAEVDPGRLQHVGGHPLAQHVVLPLGQTVDRRCPALAAVVRAPDA